MVDIHTHLLHDIDDGANQMEIAVTFLEQQKNQGVNTVVLTPHFKSDKTQVEAFCALRHARYEALRPQAERLGIELVLGCEVMCLDKEVLSMDLQKLTIGRSNFLLIEFMPTVSRYTLFRIVEALERIGFTPILAHVERYDVLNGQPDLLYQLVEAGALLQINGRTAIEDKGYFAKCMKKGLIHLVASDCHATPQRPANLAEAYAKLRKKGVNVERLKENATKVANKGFVDTSNCKRLLQIGALYF